MRLLRQPWVLAAASLFATLLGGCPAIGVGDPCTPEQVPGGGFVESEAYLETSSVQCRTRVCMVYKLDGDPNMISDTDSCVGGSGTCVSQQQVDDRVYCTCRCRAENATTPLCECPGGFACKEILKLGGDGVRGSYCVKVLPGDEEDTEE